MYKRSKKFLATGLTTAFLISAMVIPVAASGDFSDISISARVEEYIASSKAEDPVAELVGTESTTKTEKVASAAERVVAEKAGKSEKALKAEKSEDTTEEATEAAQEETPVEKDKSVKYPQFKDRVIVTVDSGVLNIRETADPEGEIVGTIDRAGIALVEEKGSEWTKVGSGNCEGYVKNEFIQFGDDAGEWAENNNIPKYIKVQNSGLRVRKGPSTDSDILDAVYENETYSVLSQEEDWVEIEMYDGTTGYVNDDYVEVRFETPKAKTVEEIAEMRRAEEEDARREKERQEAEAKAAEEAEEESSDDNDDDNSSSDSGSGSSAAERSKERIERTEEIKKENEKTITEDEEEEEAPVSTNGDLRASFVAYAKQFLGNPYVWGGTSLTNGCDCSGFTMRIYEHFGYSIPRAGGQRTFGKLIKVSEAQPGDLIFYSGHVVMYIGDGKVIHASSERVGIIISSLSYSGTPLFARNIIDAY